MSKLYKCNPCLVACTETLRELNRDESEQPSVNMHSELPRIKNTVLVVIEDYAANLHQNSVVLHSADKIDEIAARHLAVLQPSDPGYRDWKAIASLSATIKMAEREEDTRHKAIVRQMDECFPPLLNILKHLTAIAPNVSEVMERLTGLRAELRRAEG